jgi:hypothetical protein
MVPGFDYASGQLVYVLPTVANHGAHGGFYWILDRRTVSRNRKNIGSLRTILPDEKLIYNKTTIRIQRLRSMCSNYRPPRSEAYGVKNCATRSPVWRAPSSPSLNG